MRIDPAGIYASNGQPARIIPGKIDTAKLKPSTQDIKKSGNAPANFASLLSDAETKQLTKLFGKFDIKELAGNAPIEPNDDRPGQIIDILV
ncbi:MAG: hypothetical protein GX409_03650 [candidate division Zixibacteria bacterium]|jgi:hypothetical protein|nr:hypothetical protein [candidate division Zixibacteria bacterium]